MRIGFFLCVSLGISFVGKSQSDSFSLSATKLFRGQVCEVPCFAAPSLDRIEYNWVDTPCFNEVSSFFQRFPDYQFEVQAHTDCRASREYNRDYSQHLAEAFSAVLLSFGVESSTLKPKGYGESQLITNCPCEKPTDKGYKCTEEEHKLNRRLVFKVLGKDSFSIDQELLQPNQVCELPFTVDFSDEESMSDDAMKQWSSKIDFLNWVDFFNLHSGWNFEIQNHTDCRAGAGSNQELSKKRAKQLVLLLERSGVRESQLSARGYGESEPKNSCYCTEPTGKDTDCSEELRAENRRMVVKVLQRDSFKLADVNLHKGQVCELEVANYGLELFQDSGKHFMANDVYWQAAAAFLKNHSDCKFELQVHTDCRLSLTWGTDPSHTSALNLVKNLEHMGVRENVVTGRGYHYKQPKIICDCDAAYFPKCDEGQLAQNRRIVLEVLSTN